MSSLLCHISRGTADLGSQAKKRRVSVEWVNIQLGKIQSSDLNF